MPELAALKPWLTALALPPGSTLLGLLFFYWLLARSSGLAMRLLSKLGLLLSFTTLWLACCHGTAIWLERHVLKPPAAIAPAQMAALKSQGVQAIVVLGGGQHSASREYGAPSLMDASIQRLHYAALLSRQSQLPLAFSGGIGWAAKDNKDSEAAAAQRWLQELGLPGLRWQDAQSRDTAGNAQQTAALLRKDGIAHIALVTHAAHMPRALKEFEKTGLKVLPAPMGFFEPEASQGRDWFPSGRGLRHTRQVLHEMLGLAVMKVISR